MKKFLKKAGIVTGVIVFIMSVFFILEITTMSEAHFENYDLTKGDIVKKTVITGKILPRKEIAIKPQISGIVEKIYFKPGEKIKKGEVIAKVKVIPEMVNLNEAESRSTIAKMNLENAEKNHFRSKELFKRNLIAESEYEISKLNYETAKEQWETAENNLKLVKDGIFKKSKNNSNTLITSTINGTILEVPIKEGNSVIKSNSFNDGTTIAVIAEM
ncbi:MAG: efflux RND transporter periplasmic adaptor subunit, partial [Rhodothermaceae bacterium]